tara:strand:+ start:364 stop:609 length:246 start_codon:yes stop_codon:yes gene_type:complete
MRGKLANPVEPNEKTDEPNACPTTTILYESYVKIGATTALNKIISTATRQKDKSIVMISRKLIFLFFSPVQSPDKAIAIIK